MKSIKMLTIFFILIGLFGCSETKEVRKIQKEEDELEKSIEKQAKKITKKFKNEGYEICDLLDMEDAITIYLKAKSNPGSISEETSVIAPTENIGKTKCIINIKGRVAKIICDSIRYRVDESIGGDEASQSYIDSFFSASEYLGILNLGAPDFSFILTKRINKNKTEYRMFAVYSDCSMMINNGIKFGNQIKQYIDKGFSK